MWILVYIVISGAEPFALNAMGPRVTFESMYDCFEAREKLSEEVGNGSGYFKKGQQAVCIQI